MDKLGDFRCWRWQVQENLLSISVCLFVQRFALQGLSMLRNILERPIIGKRESYYFNLSFCRETFMFCQRKHPKLRPKSTSREQRIEKLLDMRRKTRFNKFWKTYQYAALSLDVSAFHSLKTNCFLQEIVSSGRATVEIRFGS